MHTSSPPPYRLRRRLGRYLLLAALGLGGLLLFVGLGLPFLLALEPVKGLLVAQAEAVLHRRLEVGQVRFHILTGLRAELEEVSIHNPPGWQQPHLARVKTLSARVAWWPLFQRRLEIRQLILRQGEVFVERDTQGRMNYADLLRPPAAGGNIPASPDHTPRLPAGSGLGALLVANTSLRQVQVTFLDHLVRPGQPLLTTVRDVRGDLRHRALLAPIEFALSAAFLSDGTPNVHWRGQLGPFPASLDLAQTPMQATLQAEAVSLQALLPYLGSPAPLTAATLDAHLTMQGQVGGRFDIHGKMSLNEAMVAPLTSQGQPTALPSLMLQVKGTVELPQAALHLETLQVDLASLQTTLTGAVRHWHSTPQLACVFVTNDFASEEVVARVPLLAAVFPWARDMQGRLQLRGTVTGPLQHLRAEIHAHSAALAVRRTAANQTGAAWQLELAGAQTTVQAHFPAAGIPEARFDLRATRLLFDHSAPHPPTGEGGGPEARPVAEPTPVSSVSSHSASRFRFPLQVQGTGTIAEGRVMRLPFQRLQADLTLRDGQVKSIHSFHAYQGTVHGELATNLAEPNPAYHLDLKLENIQANRLANELTTMPGILFGTLHTDFQVSGRGLTWEAMNRTLTGTGQVRMSNFQLTTLDLMPRLTPGLSRVGQVIGFSLPEGLAPRSFDTLQGTVSIAQGKLHTDMLHITGKDLEIMAQGVVGLDHRLAFDGTALLSGALAASLGKGALVLRDAHGRVALPFTVHGTVTQPHVALDEAALLERASKSLVENLQEKAGEELEKLLPHIRPAAPRHPESNQSDGAARELLEKSLKGLRKR